jgi:two-component system cell cycle sensor histidine kinase/response regulator CckA
MESALVAERLPVLVVDDDSALIRTLGDILRLHGYNPSTAGTAEEGLELARNTSPALAVVDLRLPDMDGLELVARLQEISTLTEVVVLTGNASVESAVGAMRQNSVDYLLKPVQVDELLRVASMATGRWQRKVVEEKLREMDERFRVVVESDLLGIMFWSKEGQILDCNNAFLKMIGYTREDLIAGRINTLEMTPREWRAKTIEKLKEARERGTVVPYEKEYIRKDGTRVPIIIGGSSLGAKRETGVGFIVDISDQKRAEMALELRAAQAAAVAAFGQKAMVTEQLSELFLESVEVIESIMHVPFATVLERKSDGTSVVMRAGKGWAPEEIGKTFTDMTKDTQAGFTMATSQPALVSNFEVEGSFPGSKKLRDKGARSGVTVPIPGPVQPFGVLAAHDKVARAFTQDDVHFMQAIAHVLGTAVERYRTEAAMRQTQRMEAVGQLAGGVAHDFNNMLTAINGYGEMVRSALPENDPLREDMDEILKAAMRAAGLTKQLLAFSRQQVLQPRPVNVNEIVKHMEGMLRRLITENIEFTLELDPKLGRVRADAGQLEQVILNLCVNARDAMPAGGRMTLETTNVDLDASRSHDPSSVASGPYVMLAVTDTGSGMDAETKAHVFEPFFTTKGQQGTGLGLATVYGVVKQSGGEIFVYSELGHGSAFKVFLPRLDEDDKRESDKKPTKAKAAAPSKGGAETVLLAEDEPAVRKLAERVLSDAGYDVLIASNGEEALKVAGKHSGTIDLLVTDMVMPEMGGRPLSLELLSRRPTLRTLYLSGYTDAGIHQKGMLPEGEPFLQKPFTGAALLQRVRDVLDVA